MSKKQEGQVAVVTGASKGIGAAIAEYQPTLGSFRDLFAVARVPLRGHPAGAPRHGVE
jgi:short-subunit dehydrogenase